eukprot:GHVU01112444.1.p1 GENE.GHVU01112444.1~~GHVU01112444.1.p1  ORF type:complete len:373 (+),score=52.00 GHVU01112444.1:95-1213(+)
MATDTQSPPTRDAMDPCKNLSDDEVDEILSRPRSLIVLGRRRKPVYQAPEFVKRLNAFEEAESGSTVTFECQFRAFPKPAIKWYKDDEEITEDDSYVVEEGENGVVRLVLEHVYKADEGAYKCKAENQEGVASTTGYLSVTGDNGDRPLSTQDRGEHEDRCVSFPPHLRTIIEQKSMEEREEEETERQGPSPIQEFIDNIEHFKKSKTWPYFENGRTERVRDDDEESNGSVTSVDSQDYERFKVISPPHSPSQSDTDSTTQLPVTHTSDTQPVMPPVAANGAVCCREDSPPCERVDTVAVKDYSMTLTDVFRDLTYHVGNLMDGLQFPWLYYMGLSVLACMAGVSTQCPVMLFVGLIAVVTLTSFRFLMITS